LSSGEVFIEQKNAIARQWLCIAPKAGTGERWEEKSRSGKIRRER